MSTNASRIFVTGDTHGTYDIRKLGTHSFPEGKDLNENDYVIICGDVAVKWDGGKQDMYIQKWFDDKPWTTLFVDG